MEQTGTLIELGQNSPLALVYFGLSKEELEYLVALIKLRGNKPCMYVDSFRPSLLNKGDIFLIDAFYDDLLLELLDWSIRIIAIGRFEIQQKTLFFENGIMSIWDLNQYKLEDISPVLLKRYTSRLKLHAYIWCDDRNFIKNLQTIFDVYSIDYISSNNPEYALHSLSENDYEILIIDWDNCGVEIQSLIHEFRKISKIKKKFPFIAGIKDFSRKELFKDLTGMKEFCKALFSPNEILALFLRSFPLNIQKQFKQNHSDLGPYIHWRVNSSDMSLILDLKPEIQNPQILYEDLKKELEIILIQEQFSWLDSFLQSA